MTEWLVDVVAQTMTSPWVYLVVLLLTVFDTFVPVVPSETAVITAGVFAASTGEPVLALVVLAAATGAVLGDHVSYGLGRFTRHRSTLRSRRQLVTAPRVLRRRGRASAAWARRAMETRGGTTLIVARFVPGGRTAVTFVSGATHYPLRRFTAFDIVAGLAWATYCALVGYVGGLAFAGDTALGVAVGIGLALSLAVVSELVRFALRRRRRRSGDPRMDDDLATPVPSAA